MGDGVTGQPAFVEVSPNDDDEFNEPFLTVVVSFVCACCLCFVDVNPFGGELAVEKMLPANCFLTMDKRFVDWGIFLWVYRGVGPMLEAEKKEAGGVG